MIFLLVHFEYHFTNWRLSPLRTSFRCVLHTIFGVKPNHSFLM